MCSGCDLKNGERTKVIDNSTTDFVVYLENSANIFRLHMTDGRHHTTKEIYHCPFCGRCLERMKGGAIEPPQEPWKDAMMNTFLKR